MVQQATETKTLFREYPKQGGLLRLFIYSLRYIVHLKLEGLGISPWILVGPSTKTGEESPFVMTKSLVMSVMTEKSTISLNKTGADFLNVL